MNVIQNNLISIIILFILFLGIYKQVNRKNQIYKVFMLLLVANIVMLVLESVILLISGTDGTFVNIVLNSTAVLYHAAIPVFMFLFFMFYEFHFHPNIHKELRYLVPFGIIFIINLVFSILSLNGGYLFQISGNVYEAGTYYVAYEFFIYGLSVVIFLYAVIQRKKLDQLALVPLVMFIVPISVSIIFTALGYMTYATFNAFSISLLIIYIGIQIQITSTDYLTGLKNRRGYEFLLYHLDKSNVSDEVIIGIVLDIDNFKNINDYFGHQQGDKALKVLGEMLKRAVRKNDFISRTGGDEFAIIIRANEPHVNEMVVSRIHQLLNDFNQKKELGFELHVSIGSGIYDVNTHGSLMNFFKQLDEEMYSNKRTKKDIQSTKEVATS